MLFENIRKIIQDHRESLIEEISYRDPWDKRIVYFIFAIFPILFGALLGYLVPLWSGFVAAAAPVLSVLTGFAINTLILLMRYSSDDQHPYTQATVRKTKEFTLYSILVGVIIIIALVFGYVLTQIDGDVGFYLTWAISGSIYGLVTHYFLTLLVITHRLWSLIHGE